VGQSYGHASAHTATLPCTARKTQHHRAYGSRFVNAGAAHSAVVNPQAQPPAPWIFGIAGPLDRPSPTVGRSGAGAGYSATTLTE